MTVRSNEIILPREITADDLVKIYISYCRSFNYEFTPEAEKFLRTKGIHDLQNGGLEYYPNPERKEAVFELRIADGCLEFWCTNFFGDDSERGDPWAKKFKAFSKDVTKYFANAHN